jgi:hypothetical protein
MTLFDVLNRANKGWKVPMYVCDCYIGSKYVTYVKRACFRTNSFLSWDRPPISRLTLVEIDHLEYRDREVTLFLKVGDQVIKHFEPSMSFQLSSLQVDNQWHIIGASVRDIHSGKRLYFFDYENASVD